MHARINLIEDDMNPGFCRYRYAMIQRPDRAFTLVELFVCIGVISLLLSLLMPAVQSAREAARRIQCTNNLRNLALGALNFEAAHKRLPGPSFNAHPNSNAYTTDTGLFVALLPYMDYTSLYSRFDLSVPCNSLSNRELLGTPPRILKCPSAQESETLINIAEFFSGPDVDGLYGKTCDYVGNNGIFTELQYVSSEYSGTIRLRIDSLVNEHRLKEVTDGTSQTLLFWESNGDALRLGNRFKNTIDRDCPPVAVVYVSGVQGIQMFTNNSIGTTKTYLYSWTGFRCGTLRPLDYEKLLNFSNLHGQPFSAHPSLVPCAMADGSVTCLHDSIDRTILMALATAHGGETIRGDY